MAITKTWSVVRMDARPEADGKQDVVLTVHWELNATDGANTGRIYGACGISEDPDAPFTAYADLTEAQVLGWVHSSIGAEAVASCESAVDVQIEDQINPPVVTNALPWAG